MKSFEKNPKKKKSSFWDDEEFNQIAQSQYLPKVKINVIQAECSGSEENSNSILKNIESFKFEKRSPLKEKNEIASLSPNPSPNRSPLKEKNEIESLSPNPSPKSSLNLNDISDSSNTITTHEKFEKSEKNELGANATPYWAQSDSARDKKLRKKGDFNYDCTTLHIPIDELNKMTPAMKQYWTIKSDNFDKIVLFKYGNFYETYYEDAVICHKALDLAWVGKKINVGFPEKSLEKYSYILVEKGYKLCLVEQTETLNQMKERVKEQEKGKKEKVIRREVVQIITRGTVSPVSTEQPRYLLSIGKWDNVIGFALFEQSKFEIQIGGFIDDESSSIFRTFNSKFQPAEIVYCNEFLTSKIKTIISESELNPLFSQIDEKKAWRNDNFLKEYFPFIPDDTKLKRSLNEMMNTKDVLLEYCFRALSGLFTYLHELKIFPRLLPICQISHFCLSDYFNKRMILDERTLINLDVINEIHSQKKSNSKSLFDYLDHTVTKSGKRLLRDWIKSPLLNPEEIEQRWDAINELASIDGLIDKIKLDLRKFPDLEKKFSRIYNMATQTGDRLISFENISEINLRDFKSILDDFIEVRSILKDLDGFGFKSYLMKSLIETRFKNEKEYDVQKIVLSSSNQIIWEGTKKDIPTPRNGIDKNYDMVKENLESIELQFQKYLNEIQTRFSDDKRICYAHSRHRFELEFPKELVEGEKKPADFEFSSKKQGFERFVTHYIKMLVGRLELAEENLKICLNEFTIKIFKEFTLYTEIWDRLTYCISLLDCLCSLATVSFNGEYSMCKPKIISNSDTNMISIKESIHPLVLLSKGVFVPNDIEINEGIILLTGPNMGGKSTIQRQVSLSIIMAQIGCFVPAKEFNFTIVDRIFTRIGAFDELSNRKSTFFIELEDISAIFKYATRNSFLVIDELGRGTSTFDGYAIAYSVLKHLALKIKCRGIFSTHFFNLADDFHEIPNILPFHMVTRVSVDDDKIQFLYKLSKGKASYNFAFNVAALAGIDKNILKVAQEMRNGFDKSIQNRKHNFTFSNIVNLLQTAMNDEFSELETVFAKLNELDVI